MGTTSKLFYAVTCDYPGCDARDDGGEFLYWGEPEHAIEAAIEGQWMQEEPIHDHHGERRLFCYGHPEHIVWLSDEDPGPMTSGNEEDARILTLPDGERVVLA